GARRNPGGDDAERVLVAVCEGGPQVPARAQGPRSGVRGPPEVSLLARAGIVRGARPGAPARDRHQPDLGCDHAALAGALAALPRAQSGAIRDRPARAALLRRTVLLHGVAKARLIVSSSRRLRRVPSNHRLRGSRRTRRYWSRTSDRLRTLPPMVSRLK